MTIDKTAPNLERYAFFEMLTKMNKPECQVHGTAARALLSFPCQSDLRQASQGADSHDSGQESTSPTPKSHSAPFNKRILKI